MQAWSEEGADLVRTWYGEGVVFAHPALSSPEIGLH